LLSFYTFQKFSDLIYLRNSFRLCVLDKTVQQNNKKKNENRVYSTQKSVALYVAANQKVVE